VKGVASRVHPRPGRGSAQPPAVGARRAWRARRAAVPARSVAPSFTPRAPRGCDL